MVVVELVVVVDGGVATGRVVVVVAAGTEVVVEAEVTATVVVGLEALSAGVVGGGVLAAGACGSATWAAEANKLGESRRTESWLAGIGAIKVVVVTSIASMGGEEDWVPEEATKSAPSATEINAMRAPRTAEPPVIDFIAASFSTRGRLP